MKAGERSMSELTALQLERIKNLEFAFGHHIITVGDFRDGMRDLGFTDAEIDEYIDDLEADEA
jgi:hypothetical protein